MSAVTSSFILLLWLRIHASDARIVLGWNPNGIPGAAYLQKKVISIRLMASQKTAASSNDNGARDNSYQIRSPFRTSSSDEERPDEMAANHLIKEAKYAKSENAKLVPSKRPFAPRTDSSPEGLFSDYSRPKMRPPSHNR